MKKLNTQHISEHCWGVKGVLEGRVPKTKNSNHLIKVVISEEYFCNCEIKIIYKSSVKNSQSCVGNMCHHTIGIQLESLFKTGSVAHLGFSSIKACTWSSQVI